MVELAEIDEMGYEVDEIKRQLSEDSVLGLLQKEERIKKLHDSSHLALMFQREEQRKRPSEIL